MPLSHTQYVKLQTVNAVCGILYRYKNRPMGVRGKQSNKQDDEELRFIHKYSGAQ
ncbi:hypothetical protein AVEN_222649-1, partial [Araneus ventricosus]